MSLYLSVFTLVHVAMGVLAVKRFHLPGDV